MLRSAVGDHHSISHSHAFDDVIISYRANRNVRVIACGGTFLEVFSLQSFEFSSSSVLWFVRVSAEDTKSKGDVGFL
jgi:hypothetical protein